MKTTEGLHHEHKLWSPDWRSHAAKTISAFSNAEGGTLSLGVSDQGDKVGVPKADVCKGREGIEQSLQRELSRLVEPPPVGLQVEIEDIAGQSERCVINVSVEPNPTDVVQSCPDRIFYKRSGSESKPMTKHEIDTLRQRRSAAWVDIDPPQKFRLLGAWKHPFRPDLVFASMAIQLVARNIGRSTATGVQARMHFNSENDGGMFLGEPTEFPEAPGVYTVHRVDTSSKSIRPSEKVALYAPLGMFFHFHRGPLSANLDSISHAFYRQAMTAPDCHLVILNDGPEFKYSFAVRSHLLGIGEDIRMYLEHQVLLD